MACKEGQFNVLELMVNDEFNTFSINLNDQHVNGMTPCTVIRYSRVRTWNLPPFLPCQMSMNSSLKKKDIILEGSLNPEAMFKVVPSSISLHCKSQKEQHNGLHHTPVAVVVSRSRLEMHYCCLDHRMKAMPREPPSSDLHHTIYLKNKNPLKKIVDEWPLKLFPEKMLRDETPRALLIFFKTVALLL